MRFLYSFSIWFFSLLITLISPFNLKARQWVTGRKGVFRKLRQSLGKDDRVIWFHCASLGEFEQGRPLMESLKKDYPDHKILLTFFSPSGYEVRKEDPIADIITYLPSDTARNAARFVNLVRPRIVFFIKYEFWFNYINQLQIKAVPIFVVSAIFRRSQYFFKPWGKWSQKQLKKVTYFFVQNEKSLALLRMVRVNHASISGDTRFDRVFKLRKENVEFPKIKAFTGNSKILVAGSTWPADEEILRNLMANMKGRMKMIVAPHVINKERIDQLRHKFSDHHPLLYSAADDGDGKESHVLIINTMGMLAHIYRYADIAYIGGGFGAGIHNTLEAATYGIPVLFGPKHERFQEAVDLKRLGSGFPVSNSNECLAVVEELMNDREKYDQSAHAASDYVKQNAGSVSRIREKIDPYLRR
ncbi:MAG: glycosyltransferase N-terminal domain-containing protein [bacterium]